MRFVPGDLPSAFAADEPPTLIKPFQASPGSPRQHGLGAIDAAEPPTPYPRWKGLAITPAYVQLLASQEGEHAASYAVADAGPDGRPHLFILTGKLATDWGSTGPIRLVVLAPRDGPGPRWGGHRMVVDWTGMRFFSSKLAPFVKATFAYEFTARGNHGTDSHWHLSVAQVDVQFTFERHLAGDRAVVTTQGTVDFTYYAFATDRTVRFRDFNHYQTIAPTLGDTANPRASREKECPKGDHVIAEALEDAFRYVYEVEPYLGFDEDRILLYDVAWGMLGERLLPAIEGAGYRRWCESGFRVLEGDLMAPGRDEADDETPGGG